MLNNEKLNSNIKLEVLKKMDWFLQTLGSTYKIEKEVDNSLIAKLIKDVKKHE